MKKIAVQIVQNGSWSFSVKPFELVGWSRKFKNLRDLTKYWKNILLKGIKWLLALTNVFMITLENISWKDNYWSRCCWCPTQTLFSRPVHQVPAMGVLAAMGSELPPSLGNGLQPKGVTSLGTIWEAVPLGTGLSQQQTDAYKSLASLSPWAINGLELPGRWGASWASAAPTSSSCFFLLL